MLTSRLLCFLCIVIPLLCIVIPTGAFPSEGRESGVEGPAVFLRACRFLRCYRILQQMRREFPEIPLVGVGAIIIEDSRVLLVKRAHPPLQAQWSIPGGVFEVGELVREAAVREAREETGLIVEPGDLLGVYDRILRNAEKRVQYHYVLIDFLCRRVGGELAAADDAAEVRWFTREELPPLNLAEVTQDVIRKGFAKFAELWTAASTALRLIVLFRLLIRTGYRLGFSRR